MDSMVIAFMISLFIQPNSFANSGDVCSAKKKDGSLTDKYIQSNDAQEVTEKYQWLNAVAYNFGCENDTCTILVSYAESEEERIKTNCCVTANSRQRTSGACDSLGNITTFNQLNTIINYLTDDKECLAGFVSFEGIITYCILESSSSRQAFVDIGECNPAAACSKTSSARNRVVYTTIPVSSILRLTDIAWLRDNQETNSFNANHERHCLLPGALVAVSIASMYQYSL